MPRKARPGPEEFLPPKVRKDGAKLSSSQAEPPKPSVQNPSGSFRRVSNDEGIHKRAAPASLIQADRLRPSKRPAPSTEPERVTRSIPSPPRGGGKNASAPLPSISPTRELMVAVKHGATPPRKEPLSKPQLKPTPLARSVEQRALSGSVAADGAGERKRTLGRSTTSSTKKASSGERANAAAAEVAAASVGAAAATTAGAAAAGRATDKASSASQWEGRRRHAPDDEELERLYARRPDLQRRLRSDHELYLSRLSVSDFSFKEVRRFLEKTKGWDYAKGSGINTWCYRAPSAIAAAKTARSSKGSGGGGSASGARLPQEGVDFFTTEEAVCEFLEQQGQRLLLIELCEHIFAIHRRGVLLEASRAKRSREDDEGEEACESEHDMVGAIAGGAGDVSVAPAANAADSMEEDESDQGDAEEPQAHSAIDSGAQAYFDSRANRKSRAAKGAIASAAAGKAMRSAGGRGAKGKQRRGRQTKYSRWARLDRVLGEASAAAMAAAKPRDADAGSGAPGAGAAAAAAAAVGPKGAKSGPKPGAKAAAAKKVVTFSEPEKEKAADEMGASGSELDDEDGAESDDDSDGKGSTKWPPMPPLPPARHHELVRRCLVRDHATERKQLLARYEGEFTRWHLWLISGFSVLLHGYGSKFDLIRRFGEHLRSADKRNIGMGREMSRKMGSCGGPVLFVYGFEPDASVRQVLDGLSAGCFPGRFDLADPNLVRYAENLAAALEAAHPRGSLLGPKTFLCQSSFAPSKHVSEGRRNRPNTTTTTTGESCGAASRPGDAQAPSREGRLQHAEAAETKHNNNNKEREGSEMPPPPLKGPTRAGQPLPQRAAAAKATEALAAARLVDGRRLSGGSGSSSNASTVGGASPGPGAPPRRLFLLVHSIDGERLRDEDSQMALSVLAHCRIIHLVATVDHVNAALLWDSLLEERFCFVSEHTPTFEPYLRESNGHVGGTDGGGRGGRGGGAGAANGGQGLHAQEAEAASVAAVLSCLSPRQLELLQLVGQRMRAHVDGAGVPWPVLERECKRLGLVQQPAQLAQLAADLKEHKLLGTRLKGQEQFVSIPRSAHIVDHVLSFVKEP